MPTSPQCAPSSSGFGEKLAAQAVTRWESRLSKRPRADRFGGPCRKAAQALPEKVVAADKTQIHIQARVLEIGRSGIIAKPDPARRRPSFGERLRTELSPLRKSAGSLVTGSLWIRILCSVLAVLTGAIWALSLALFLLSTGWPALFHFGYLAGAAGFAVTCALTAADPSSPDQLGREVDARIYGKWRPRVSRNPDD